MTSSVSTSSSGPPPSVAWSGGTEGVLRLLDQTRLPDEIVQITCRTVADVFQAIRSLQVRGAPAIGIAAAYGVVLASQAAASQTLKVDFVASIERDIEHLAESRPTAVNLFWALARMKGRLTAAAASDAAQETIAEKLLAEARAIHEEDRQMCRAIGRHGAALLKGCSGVLTHCNTGGLATAEYGTALSAIFTCQDQGHLLHVYADETRPLLQGARLTAWELQQRRIPVTLICDSMAAVVMREKKVQAVIVGADRIAANGDTANKIGTYGLAVLAAAHQIPFYVAAPTSTFDLALDSGAGIPIEERGEAEITCGFGRRTAPQGIAVYNPAFDVTPASLIRALVTERGVIQPVDRPQIAAMVGKS